MKKQGSKKIIMVSLDPVLIEDWMFKVSTYDGNVMVFAYNKLFQWSSIRYFNTEDGAKNFVDYLVMQSKNLKEKN